MPTRPLSSGLQKIAEIELNEDPARTEDDLKHIKEWLEKQPHFNIRRDDQLFLFFLRGCKFSLERTKEKLDNYYRIRGIMPEYFSNRDPLLPELQEILNAEILMALPNTKDSIGPRIYLYRWQKCDVEKMTVLNIFKICLMSTDIQILEDDNAAVSGLHLIFDYKNFAPGYVLQFTPTFASNCFYCETSGYPFRIKRIDCINVSPIFETVFKIATQFMSAKLKERIHAFSSANVEEFHKIVPRDFLPKEYGGKAGPIAELAKTLKEKIESRREWFMEEEKYGTVESLRPGNSGESGEMFGMEGTFRKINLD